MSKAKVISIINMKGGVGKTTLTKEIGFFLSEIKGNKVLLIDVDPQLNLTQAIFKRFNYAQSEELANETEIVKNDEEEANYEIKEAKTRPTISKASIERIFSSTASSPVGTDEVIQPITSNLSIIPGELGIEFSLRNLNSGRLENGIYDFIKKNNLREQFDYILIDCPPTYSSYTVAALKPSDFFLVPVKAEAYSILGLDMLLKVVDSVVSENDIYFDTKPLNNLGIIFTDIPNTPSRGTEKMIQSIKDSKTIQSRNTTIFSTYFRKNTSLRNKIEYVISYSKSDLSFQNLNLLVSEMIERIDTIERRNTIS